MRKIGRLSLIWTWVSIACSPYAVNSDPGAAPLDFSSACRISDVQLIADTVYIMITARGAFWHMRTLVQLGPEGLEDAYGGLRPWNTIALGRGEHGAPIIAQKPLGLSKIRVRRLRDDPGRPLESFELRTNERFLAFLGNHPQTYLTTHRIGVVSGESRELSDVLDPQSLFHADISRGRVLCAWNAQLTHVSPIKRPAQMAVIDCQTGEVERLSVSVLDTERWKFDAFSDRVTGIVAPSIDEGVFYVSVGRIGGEGYLGRFTLSGELQVVFQKESRRLLGIRGVEGSGIETADTIFEPVLALSLDSDHQLSWISPYGVYRLEDPSSPQFVEVPKFELVGGFYVAQNVPKVAVVLSTYASSDRPLYALRVSDVYMVSRE